MHCLYGGYNLHRFSDALGLVFIDLDGCHKCVVDGCTFIQPKNSLLGIDFGPILQNNVAARALPIAANSRM